MECNARPNNTWYAIDTSLHKDSFSQFGGRNPVDRGKRGVKSIVMADYKGVPIFIDVAAANIHDSQLLPHVVSRLRTSHRARILAAAAAFDSTKLKPLCARKNIALLSATNPRRNSFAWKYQPPHRWIIERTFGWLSWFRGLKPCRSKSYISCVSLFQIAATIIIGRML